MFNFAGLSTKRNQLGDLVLRSNGGFRLNTSAFEKLNFNPETQKILLDKDLNTKAFWIGVYKDGIDVTKDGIFSRKALHKAMGGTNKVWKIVDEDPTEFSGVKFYRLELLEGVKGNDEGEAEMERTVEQEAVKLTPSIN